MAGLGISSLIERDPNEQNIFVSYRLPSTIRTPLYCNGTMSKGLAALPDDASRTTSVCRVRAKLVPMWHSSRKMSCVPKRYKKMYFVIEKGGRTWGTITKPGSPTHCSLSVPASVSLDDAEWKGAATQPTTASTSGCLNS